MKRNKYVIKIKFVASVCFLLILLTILFYYCNVGRYKGFSDDAQQWGLFGDYFGGVAGTLITFVSVIILGITLLYQQKQIRLNQKQIKSNQKQILKQDILLQISKVDDEIERWLNRELATNSNLGGNFIKFGDLVWSLVSYNDSLVESTEFNRALERLLKLACTYCSAINLYEDNINSYFIHGHYRQKASEIITFLELHKNKPNSMAAISLDFCKEHLR